MSRAPSSEHSPTERQMHALIELVETDRKAREAALRQAADQACAEILRTARAAARERSHAALAEERRRRSHALAATTARLANEERQFEQQTHAALLALAWQRLPHLLEARWADPEARRDWIAHVFAAARLALPAGAWTLVHGPGLSESDRDTLAELAAEAGVSLELVADPAIHGGLKLRAGGNVIDGTAAGLLADRAAIGARLLDLLQETS